MWLNRGLSKLEAWGPSEIESRGRALAEVAVKIWKPLAADVSAIREAELDDALLAAGDKTRADVLCPDGVRSWLNQLADFTVSLGDDVVEVPSLKNLVYRMPSWFVELLPRANCIDVRFATDPAGLAAIAPWVQASSSWARILNSAIPGTEGSIYTVNSEAKLQNAFALNRKAYEIESDNA